ncbi:TPA: MFS transporter [Photobacterium damselae]
MNNRKGWLSYEVYLLLCVCLAQIITSADNITTALSIKEIMLFFDVNLSTGQIITSFYSVICASLMIISGVFGYFINWKKIFQLGLFFTFLGEIFAITSEQLLSFVGLSRIFFGLGASLLLPACVSLLSTIIRKKNRVLAFSIWGTSVAVVIAVFPLLLSVLYYYWEWRSGYIILAILSLVVLGLSFKMPEPDFKKLNIKINVFEIILVFVTLMLFLLGVVLIPKFGFITPSVSVGIYIFDYISIPLVLFITSIATFFIYLNIKNKNDSIIPKSFYSLTSLCGFYMLALLYVIYGGVLFVIVSYISLGQYSSITLALSTTIFAISMFISSVVAATVLKNKTSQELNTMGLTIITVSLLFLAIVMQPKIPSYYFYIALTPIGIGCGFIATKINLVINYSVGSQWASQSSGVQASAKNIGYVLGVISFGMLLTYVTKYEFIDVINTHIIFIDSTESFSQIVLNGLNFMSDNQLTDYLDHLSLDYNKTEISLINTIIKSKAISVVLIVGAILTICSIPIGKKVASC